MFQSLLVSHKEITTTLLDEIIRIKSIAWPYSYEKQLEWIYNNLKDTDIHVLLYLDGSLVAYLNLIEIEFKIDGDLKNGYGIGNVCAREKGKGWGKKLLNRTNTYLKDNNKIGLLFCKSQLVKFYTDNDWKIVNITILNNHPLNNDVFTMAFNSLGELCHIEYAGTQF